VIFIACWKKNFVLKYNKDNNIYCDVKGKICNFLNKFLHETLFPHPSIILIAFFCILKIMELWHGANKTVSLCTAAGKFVMPNTVFY
jgi:hypothetical protein